jgi:hypothetical protein
MALIDYQTALGRLVRSRPAEIDDAPQRQWQDLALSNRERASLESTLGGRGLHFTREVQRSWCKGRARNTAYLTLSVMPEAQRQALLDAWVDSGGGIASFSTGEAERLLDFIALRLPPRSHAFSLCRMEQAVHRANAALASGHVTEAGVAGGVLCRAASASMVEFFAEPNLVLQAVQSNAPLPPLSDSVVPVFFSPKLPGMFRRAEPCDAALWRRLEQPAGSAAVHLDCAEAGLAATVETLLAQGILDTAA